MDAKALAEAARRAAQIDSGEVVLVPGEEVARRARALLGDDTPWPDQQPIQRTVGQRVSAPGRNSPVPGAQDTSHRTRAPKGVYIYRSQDEMAADRLRWTIDLMTERTADR